MHPFSALYEELKQRARARRQDRLMLIALAVFTIMGIVLFILAVAAQIPLIG